jgi:heme A synthase
MVLPLLILRMKRTDEMSETQQFKSFRIWAAVGVALLYLVLAASGNA